MNGLNVIFAFAFIAKLIPFAQHYFANAKRYATNANLCNIVAKIQITTQSLQSVRASYRFALYMGEAIKNHHQTRERG